MTLIYCTVLHCTKLTLGTAVLLFSRAKYNRAKDHRAKYNRAKDNRAKYNRAKDNRVYDNRAGVYSATQ